VDSSPKSVLTLVSPLRSEYTVNAMDADELRRSQRRYKNKGGGSSRAHQVHSQESDLDDEEEEDEGAVSTPSADTSDRNLMSMSSENVDLVGRRERFLKSNFESLSGAEDNHGNHAGMNKSISNQFFREGSSAVQRNAKTIARAQSFRDEEQNKKREELQRRIEETRKKLQNVSDSLKEYPASDTSPSSSPHRSDTGPC
jgi:hypothetical protein